MPTAGSPPEITVAAASDLQIAFTEIGRSFEEQQGCRVVFTFMSSGQLAQQIEYGAPFDVFAAANVEFVNRLADKQRVIADTKQLYARGRIVLAVSAQARGTVTKLEDLLNSQIKHVAIANPAHAPYGLAAKQALEHCGLWEQLEPKLVLAENVRMALQYVQTGNAQAGIVAHSVADASNISYTQIEESFHEPLDQAIAVVAGTSHENFARAFNTYVVSAGGQAILQKHRFQLPKEKTPSGSSP